MMNLRAATLALLLAITGFAPKAEAQSACEFYRVQKGDSLRDLAEAVYGDKNYRRIWNANRKVVGRNPSLISVGMVLKLPCLDGNLPEGAAPVPATPEGLSFVTGNGYLPYTDESLKDRGLVTALVTKAMLRAAPETPVEVVFVNDWAAHLDVLLPRQAFDASFPWTAPGCDSQSALTQSELQACQTYLYSDPIYEIVEAFFSRPGAGYEKMTNATGFAEARICRPEGYPTGHLDELGLVRADLTLDHPETAYECFIRLIAGKVDLVALDSRAADRVLKDLGLTHQVVENPFVTHIAPLRVALHKDNPKAQATLDALNAGLAQMMKSGEWTSIVTEGLKDPGALVN